MDDNSLSGASKESSRISKSRKPGPLSERPTLAKDIESMYFRVFHIPRLRNAWSRCPIWTSETTVFDSSDSVVDTPNECRLPTSKYVRLFKANPVKLKPCWDPNTVVGLLPFPFFRYFAIVDSEVEIVAHMN